MGSLAMKLQMVGCSHHHTDIAFREKLAFQPNQVVEALARMRVAFPQSESVLLSTCNRIEIYTAAEDEENCPSASELINFVANYHGLAPEEVATELQGMQDLPELSKDPEKLLRDSEILVS